MGIKIKTSKAEFVQYIHNSIDDLIKKQIDIMKYVGAKAYQAQMNTRGGTGVYMTQTGNLQSSIGYAVLRKGKVLFKAGFENNDGTEQGTKGASDGEQYLNEIIDGLGSADLALVMVAGMNYAVYVEDMGLNVLTTAQLTADKLLSEINRQLSK